MQVILDSSFARPGSAPIWGGKKGEFRDWTNSTQTWPRESKMAISLRIPVFSTIKTAYVQATVNFDSGLCLS